MCCCESSPAATASSTPTATTRTSASQSRLLRRSNMREQLLSRVPHGLSLLATLLIAAGCAVGPVYERPNAPTPATFKEAVTTTAADAASWKSAQPSEEVARGRWWTVFGDPRLDNLEQQALDANQNLKAAAARLKQARALAQAAHADLRPSLDA